MCDQEPRISPPKSLFVEYPKQWLGHWQPRKDVLFPAAPPRGRAALVVHVVRVVHTVLAGGRA
eukprot:CAMPEP_0184230664 /NCGR_PEP_ID=MMETSP0976-20121227/22886_1 /TAXON_ID=483370 /ORGANISM="non described non described, Strain CCMP2097" /LENGTH=62 /DNA_ID=CAMNT_0026535655 /DNA_START=38 /DNA_END=223 /DNA_ORIENTATION=+